MQLSILARARRKVLTGVAAIAVGAALVTSGCGQADDAGNSAATKLDDVEPATSDSSPSDTAKPTGTASPMSTAMDDPSPGGLADVDARDSKDQDSDRNRDSDAAQDAESDPDRPADTDGTDNGTGQSGESTTGGDRHDGGDSSSDDDESGNADDSEQEDSSDKSDKVDMGRYCDAAATMEDDFKAAMNGSDGSAVVNVVRNVADLAPKDIKPDWITMVKAVELMVEHHDNKSELAAEMEKMDAEGAQERIDRHLEKNCA